MTVSKQRCVKGVCEVYHQGRDGRHIRRQFSTKGEAEAFDARAHPDPLAAFDGCNVAAGDA